MDYKDLKTTFLYAGLMWEQMNKEMQENALQSYECSSYFIDN